jgi:hypothetical protein
VGREKSCMRDSNDLKSTKYQDTSISLLTPRIGPDSKTERALGEQFK